MVSAYKTMVSIFEIGFKRYYSFLRNFLDGFLQVSNVFALFDEIFKNGSVELLRRGVVFLKMFSWSNEPLTVFI
jgi:hypothetical protein